MRSILSNVNELFRKELIKVNIKKVKHKTKSCAFLLVTLAIVFTTAFCVQKINADSNVIYTDPNGIEYTTDDIYTYSSINCAWNISDTGTDNLWAYIFPEKDENGEIIKLNETDDKLMLVLTGNYRKNYDYSALFEPIYCVYLTENGVVDSLSSQRDLVPWSGYPDTCNNIHTVVIDEGCNPESYPFFFSYLSNLEEIKCLGDTKTPKKLDNMFNYNSSIEKISFPDNFDTSQVSSMRYTFKGCSALTDLDISNWASSSCYNHASMFNGCTSLKFLDLRGMDFQDGSGPGNWYEIFKDVPLQSVMAPVIIPTNNPNITSLGNGFAYYNLNETTGVKTRLILDGKAMGTLIGKNQVTSITDMAGNSTDLEFNYIEIPALYTDKYGNNYYSEDLVSGASWNISDTGTDDLYAYIFKEKDENGSYIPNSQNTLTHYDLIFVITGSYTKMFDFEKYWYMDWSTFTQYYVSKDSMEPYVAAGNWRDKKSIPWTEAIFIDVVYEISKVIIDKGCNPESYPFIFTGFTNGGIVFDEEDGHYKTPKDLSCSFYGNWCIENIDLSKVDTSNVTNMEHMFDGCSNIASLDLSSFDLSNCVKFDGMFKGCSSLKHLNLSGLDFGTNNSYTDMFDGVSIDDIYLPSVIPSGSATFEALGNDFAYYNKTNEAKTRLKVNGNKVGAVVGTSGVALTNMQDESTPLTLNYAELNPIYVDKNGNEYTQNDLSKYNDENGVQTLARWNISKSGTDDLWANVFDIKGSGYQKMLVITGTSTEILDFEYVYSYTTGSNNMFCYDDTINDDNNLGTINKSDWREYKITPWSVHNLNSNIYKCIISSESNPNSYKMLCFGCGSLNEFIIEPFEDGSDKKVNNLRCLFANTGLNEFVFPAHLDTSDVEDIAYMFYNVYNLERVDFTNFNSNKVKSVSNMFYYCYNLEEFTSPENFRPKITGDASKMFYGCYKLPYINVSMWDLSNATNLYQMFQGCNKLATIEGHENWDTSSVENFSALFEGCNVLQDVNIDKWDVSNGTNFAYMFSNCKTLENIDIASWDMSNATNINSMFAYTTKLKYISLEGWDLSKTEDLSWLFGGCEKLVAVNLKDVTLPSQSDLRYIFQSCSELKFVNLTGLDIVDKNDNYSSIFDSLLINCVLLPDSIGSNQMTVGQNLKYFNIDGDTITPLKFKGSESSNVIIPKTLGADVTDLNDNPSNLEINCMMKDESSTIYIWPQSNDLQIEEKTYNFGDAIEFKLKYNETLKLLNGNLDEKKIPELVLTFAGDAASTIGTGNVIIATFKELIDDTITFIYNIANNDKVSGTSTFSISKFFNKGQITNNDGLTVLKPTLSKTLTSLKVNYEEPSGGGSSHKKKKVEEPKPIEPEKEETKSHKKAVMQGYEDKTFKPNEFVSREEVATIFARALEGFSEDSDFKEYNDFDDADGRWSENYLGFLKSKELVQGYADGTYRPTENMTRAELCVLVSNFKEFRDSDAGSLNANSSFPDVKGRWFEPYVNKLVALGIIQGYDDGEFKGERYVTRTEMAIVMNRVDKRQIDNIPDEYLDKVVAMFKDVKKTDWFIKDLALAVLDLPDEWFDEEEPENK